MKLHDEALRRRIDARLEREEGALAVMQPLLRRCNAAGAGRTPQEWRLRGSNSCFRAPSGVRKHEFDPRSAPNTSEPARSARPAVDTDCVGAGGEGGGAAGPASAVSTNYLT